MPRRRADPPEPIDERSPLAQQRAFIARLGEIQARRAQGAESFDDVMALADQLREERERWDS